MASLVHFHMAAAMGGDEWTILVVSTDTAKAAVWFFCEWLGVATECDWRLAGYGVGLWELLSRIVLVFIPTAFIGHESSIAANTEYCLIPAVLAVPIPNTSFGLAPLSLLLCGKVDSACAVCFST